MNVEIVNLFQSFWRFDIQRGDQALNVNSHLKVILLLTNECIVSIAKVEAFVCVYPVAKLCSKVKV